MIDERVESYLKSLIPSRSEAIEAIEQYAEEHRVPIMDLVSMESLLQQLKLIQPKRILELGAAIGYSAIRMVESLPNAKIVTIERDEKRYKEALSNIKKLQLEDRIEVVFGDALEVASTFANSITFDVLFIDAAKGQYERFFELYSPFVKEGGVIFSDNVLFRGLVSEEQIEQRRIRSLVKKIRHYNEWLMAHPQYETRILPVGDGLAISIKK